jgi:2-enoate reductase
MGQLGKLDIALRLGERFTPDLLPGLRPDAVVLATGARATRPDIPGVELGHTLTATEVFAGAATGERAVVVGAELVGSEAALYLAERGKRVTLLGRSREPAARVPTDLRAYLLWALPAQGIEVHSRAEVVEIVAGGVIYRDIAGERRTVPADSVVFATGARPENGLAAALAGRVPALFSIGDCQRPRGIREAIREGYEVALAL